MGKLLKMFGVAALLGVLMMVGGCGGGDDAVATDPSVTSPIAATVNANGTATTGATVTKVDTPADATGYLDNVSVSLPANTVITAKNADGTTKVLTAPPSITFTAPTDSTATSSGVHDVPVQPGLTVVNTTGAIRIEITGAASATFSNPVTITMPVPGEAVGSVLKVYTAKEGSTTYTLLGSFTVATAGFVSFPVSSFSWFTTGVYTLGSLPAGTATVGQLYTFNPIVKDQGGITLTGLTFDINKTPGWASFNVGVLSGTPALADAGTSTNGIVISFTRSGETSKKTLPPFSITVLTVVPSTSTTTVVPSTSTTTVVPSTSTTTVTTTISGSPGGTL